MATLGKEFTEEEKKDMPLYPDRYSGWADRQYNRPDLKAL